MAIRARVRARPPEIPDIEPGFIVDARRAQIDRLKITFRDGLIHASELALLRTWRQNGARKVKAQNGFVKFVYYSDTGVFSATLIARRDQGSHRHWSLTVELELNVTKYAVLCGCRANQSIPLIDPERSMTLSLDGNENYVPSHMLSRSWSLNWPVKAVECMNWAFGEVATIVQAPVGGSRSQVAFTQRPYAATLTPERWALSGLEVYWEAKCADALGFVCLLEGLGAQIADGLQTTYHPTVIPGAGSERNARVLRFALGRNTVSLIVYAKLVDRIRMEVRYNSNVRSLLRHLPAPTMLTVLSLLETAIENATERTNRLLQSAWSRNAEPPAYLFRLSQFLHAVCIAFSANSANVQIFLSGILANGRVQMTSDQAFNDGLQWLVRRNYLVQHRISLRTVVRTYSPSRPYLGVIRALASLPMTLQSRLR